MNREIKFRAYDSISKMIHQWWRIKKIGISLFDLDHYTLMQYTGLKDMNGKEIYADDLLSDGEITFRVYHVNGGFVIKARAWAKDTSNPVPTDELIWQPLPDAQTRGYLEQSCKIIGNTHQNPELKP
jgi:uncharacterized phage protein (TIGR01671 family)